jgi:hypothetical protein
MKKLIMPIVYVVFASGMLVVLLALSFPAFGAFSDFPEYYSAAKLVLSGTGSQIYDLKTFAGVEQNFFPELNGRIVGFFVPPFAMAWIIPIGLIPLPAAIYVWKLILVSALVLSVILLSKAFSLTRVGVLYLIAVTALSGATYEALRIDQLATILLLGLSMYIFGVKKERPWLSAAGLALMVLKPQELLPLIVFLLAAGQWKLVLRFAAIACVIALIGCAAVGVDGIKNYATLMASTVNDTRFLVSDLSPSLRGQLLRLFPDAATLTAQISTGFLVLSLAVIAFVGRLMKNAKQWLEASILVSLPLGLASCLYFFSYDLVLLLPTIIILLREDIQKQIPAPALLAGMLGALIYLMPMSILIHYSYLQPEHGTGGVLNPNFIALFLFAVGVTFFVGRRKDLFA